MARHSSGSASPPGRRRPWLWLSGLAALAGAGLIWLVLADRPAVVAVETLTAGLSRKIWQKIMVLDRFEGEAPA